MSLPPNEISQHLADPGYDPMGVLEFYNEIKPFEEFYNKESMTVQEAYEFLMNNDNPAKQAIARHFGYPLGSVNFYQ